MTYKVRQSSFLEMCFFMKEYFLFIQLPFQNNQQTISLNLLDLSQLLIFLFIHLCPPNLINLGFLMSQIHLNVQQFFLSEDLLEPQNLPCTLRISIAIYQIISQILLLFPVLNHYTPYPITYPMIPSHCLTKTFSYQYPPTMNFCFIISPYLCNNGGMP